MSLGRGNGDGRLGPCATAQSHQYFVPHPRLAHPEIIEMDYGMTDGSIRMRVRAAVAGYMLRHWRVDCSPDHHLQDEPYRLWLRDPLALYGVENAKLAPGYQAPAAKTSRKR